MVVTVERMRGLVLDLLSWIIARFGVCSDQQQVLSTEAAVGGTELDEEEQVKEKSLKFFRIIIFVDI